MAEDGNANAIDQLRVKYGFYIVGGGLLIVAGAFVAAVVRWAAAADVTTVMGSVTAVVGTLVGAFTGIQVGSAGKEKAEKARANAENTALIFAAHTDPRVAHRLLAEAGLTPISRQPRK